MRGEPVSTPSRPPPKPFTSTSANTRFEPMGEADGMPGMPMVPNPAEPPPQPVAATSRRVKKSEAFLFMSQASDDCRGRATDPDSCASVHTLSGGTPMRLETREAPDFSTDAVVGDGDFKKVSLGDYKGKYVVLFFYPADFTVIRSTRVT